ncbi:hypothetical protein B0H13DRAFT_1926434 [Mycena leptocephala]|nr:hypothetical protein B0H13DRAFT_1926434 [Mycena leptocephala]
MFVLVWNGIFEAIQTITGQSLNFKVFSKSSSLLGALGDLEGAQAQALGVVIILRRLNLKTVDGIATVDVDIILTFVWKTCLVHFQCGVFTVETHLENLEFQYLLSFPYLETDADIEEYYTFCGASKNPKLKGSHAHDSQVNKTNATLLEAILSARQFDGENTRIIKGSLESGIWENGNNSIHARFSSQAARQSRSRQKKAELNCDRNQRVDLSLQLHVVPVHRTAIAGAGFSDEGIEPLPWLAAPIVELRSDFNYPAALNSDVLDYTLNAIIEDHPMYPVDGDDEILASDPHPTPLSRSS